MNLGGILTSDNVWFYPTGGDLGDLNLSGFLTYCFWARIGILMGGLGSAFLKLCSLFADSYVVYGGRFSGGALRGAGRWRNRSVKLVSLKHVECSGCCTCFFCASDGDGVPLLLIPPRLRRTCSTGGFLPRRTCGFDIGHLAVLLEKWGDCYRGLI